MRGIVPLKKRVLGRLIAQKKAKLGFLDQQSITSMETTIVASGVLICAMVWAL